jgi:hypothetical protein
VFTWHPVRRCVVGLTVPHILRISCSHSTSPCASLPATLAAGEAPPGAPPRNGVHHFSRIDIGGDREPGQGQGDLGHGHGQGLLDQVVGPCLCRHMEDDERHSMQVLLEELHQLRVWQAARRTGTLSVNMKYVHNMCGTIGPTTHHLTGCQVNTTKNTADMAKLIIEAQVVCGTGTPQPPDTRTPAHGSNSRSLLQHHLQEHFPRTLHCLHPSHVRVTGLPPPPTCAVLHAEQAASSRVTWSPATNGWRRSTTRPSSSIPSCRICERR